MDQPCREYSNIKGQYKNIRSRCLVWDVIDEELMGFFYHAMTVISQLPVSVCLEKLSLKQL